MLKKFFMVVVMACAALMCTTPAQAQSSGFWWHNLMTQYGRNQQIVYRALNENGRYTGVQCKEWVQNVVWGASSGTVWLPQNRPDGAGWYWSNWAMPVWNIPYAGPSYAAQPGNIIQMVWRNNNNVTNPHTAIVLSNNSQGMQWIDCNWFGDRSVRVHYISHDQFRQAVGWNCTVYEVR